MIFPYGSELDQLLTEDGKASAMRIGDRSFNVILKATNKNDPQDTAKKNVTVTVKGNTDKYPELFKKVARRDGLEKVFEGIEAALAHPGLSLKINSVPVIKEKENFIGIAGLAQKYPIHVRFIEMMPIGFGKQFPFQDEESIKAVLEEAYGPMHAVNERYGNGPCHYYEIAGFKGKIGFISAMTHKFCSQCNRVRLTSEGFMKGCLQYQKGTDLRGLMRGGCTDSELKKAIYQVIWNKPVSHNFYEAKTEQDEIRGMSQIGG